MRRSFQTVVPSVFAVLTIASAPATAAAQNVPAADVVQEATGSIDAEPIMEKSALERWREDPATIFDAREVDLADFMWIARPIVVFANSAEDPAFRDQMQLLTARPGPLIDRDVVIITDTNPGDPSDIRLRLRPRAFMLTLIGKDGGIKLRKPLPWAEREISRVINKMPMRQREINNTPVPRDTQPPD